MDHETCLTHANQWRVHATRELYHCVVEVRSHVIHRSAIRLLQFSHCKLARSSLTGPCQATIGRKQGTKQMTREQALPYVSYVLDDALSADHTIADLKPDARLVGWQCGFEPLFVAVQSYIPGVVLDADEAEEIARDYLEEIKWFADGPTDADYII